MTVKQLIEELQKQDPEKDAVVRVQRNEGENIVNPANIIVNPANTSGEGKRIQDVKFTTTAAVIVV